MIPIQKEILELKETFFETDSPVLSIYADINPAKPENAGRAWAKRIKNALKTLPEIHNAQGKRDTPLYDAVLELIDQERPQARTLALFATRGRHGRLLTKRLDLQVELPVVDLAHGRVDARWGDPYLTPLFFAADEYEPTGVLHLEGSGWRFYEVFLGEVSEDSDIFKEITIEDWKELEELTARIDNATSLRKAMGGKGFDRLSPKERESAKISAWMHRLYMRLAVALEKAVMRLNIQRLVFMGEDWQTRHFEGYLSRGLRNRVVAHVAHPANRKAPSSRDIMERVQPVLEAAERAAEMELLDRIAKQPGARGLDEALDALQMGRVDVLVLPWKLEAKIWRCPKEGVVACSEEMARIFCDEPQQVALRDYVWLLAQEYGARLEFVRGSAEERVLKEFAGAAALLRW